MGLLIWFYSRDKSLDFEKITQAVDEEFNSRPPAKPYSFP